MAMPADDEHDGHQEHEPRDQRAIWAPRLPEEQLRRNFHEVRRALSDEEALAEAQRCFYCEYDVACMRGCPTTIDIPKFIKEIAQGDPEQAARTILESNIFGAVCARVCPVEKLCEQNCIADTIHLRPIPIGQLQRHATDRLLASGHLPFERAAATGKRVAVVGGGPAGISGAFELARRGHDVTVFDRETEPGGLDRYGIAEYKIDAAFVRRELEYLLQLGGVTLRLAEAVDAARLAALRKEHDAVLVAVGLGETRRLGIPGEDLRGVQDALSFIRHIKEGPLPAVPVGERVVVVGAGNTAIDAATQAKRLGAGQVTVVYRRGRADVKCTDHEYDLSIADGCEWLWHAAPQEALEDPQRPGHVGAVRFARRGADGGAESGPDTVELLCDHLVKAIGQEPRDWLDEVEGLGREPNRTLRVNPTTLMTSLRGVFAAGDCVLRAKEVVNAVAEGKRAALSIDGWLAHARPSWF
jgi:glutamate synthase (NADPH/NADH) small chain